VVCPSHGRAQDSPASASGFPRDPIADRLVDESLAARPELKQAQASVRAERSRVPQAGALPDPVVTLGIQNDSFDSIQIGEAETSFYQVMVSQGLPWPGKRGLRTDMAELEAEQAEATLKRARLTTEADVRRAYVDLLLVRDRLLLLADLERVWDKSSGTARARYESGEAAQSDVLRSQLELNRLRQRKAALRSEERTTLQTLNTLRAHPLDEPIVTSTGIRRLGTPVLPSLEQATADAVAASPELALSRLAASRARKQTALAERERFPDLNLNLGVMPRGDLDPMWAAGVSVSVPLWSHRKQLPAIEESKARSDAELSSALAVEQTLRMRVAERHAALDALLATIRLYRDGLLVQSQATAESTLAQYGVGKLTFASVLEANAGYINDQESYLSALADAERIVIANAEISLAPASLGSMGASFSPAAMPGTPSMPSASTRAASAAAPSRDAAPQSMPPGM
jgi:outer membrane protein TolC